VGGNSEIELEGERKALTSPVNEDKMKENFDKVLQEIH
jgi:hypothetical protein